MNARRAIFPVVIVLVLAGLLLVNLRLRVGPVEPVHPGDSFWRLAYQIQFTAKTPKSRLRVAFPADTPHSRLQQLDYDLPEVSVERRGRTHSQTREIEITSHKTGPQSITPKFDIHISPRVLWPSARESGHVNAETRESLLRSRKGIEVDDPLVKSTLDKLQAVPSSQVELVDRIFEYCIASLTSGGREAPSEAAVVLKQGVGSTLGRARTMVALCRAAKIPARLITGLQVKQSEEIRPHVWLEVLSTGRWEPFDPENGFSRELPHNYLPLRRDGGAIVQADEVDNLRVVYSATRIYPASSVRTEGRQFWEVLDLSRLPVEMHGTLVVILLMPLGALVTAVFRTVIGIRTFGTFTPTLVALAFVYNDWKTGLIVFVMVMVLGLSTRKLLDYLKLLLVPRLSIILTLVALCMVFAVSILDYFSLTPSAQAVLLPMVILTMIVERFFLTSEEDSMPFAVRLLGNTLLVAAGCYLVLRWRTVGDWLLHYPEIHLVTIAVFVLLGRYTGYRISELFRFRDLTQPPSSPPSAA